MQHAEGVSEVRYFKMGRWIRESRGVDGAAGHGTVERQDSVPYHGCPAQVGALASGGPGLQPGFVIALLVSAAAPSGLSVPLSELFPAAVSRACYCDLHDLSIFRYPQFHRPAGVQLMRSEIPKTLRRAAHLITDSEAIRREVIGFFSWPAERVTAVPLGVDAAFRPRSVAEVLPCLVVTGWRLGVTRCAWRRSSPGRISAICWRHMPACR